MAIYMKYGPIDGAVKTDGFDKWMELTSFQMGINRAIGTAARGAYSRESSEPNISEITVTKLMDLSAAKLFNDAVAGQLDNKVTIKLTTTAKDKVETFLTYEMENCGISSYSISTGGDLPMEGLTLNFTKITERFIGFDPGITGSPETVGYDLQLMKKV